MPIGRYQVTIPRDSNNPEDAIVNTWHFALINDFIADLDLPATALQNFYNNLATYISSDIDPNNMRLKVYDLEDPEPRSPKYDGPLGTMNNTTGGDPLPEELSVCLSYRAVYESGENPARRRGRIYIGGLGAATLPGTGVPRRPAAAFRTALKNAGQTLLNASVAATEWNWIVYSPTAGIGNVVVGGWVDDAWDVQRRRGVERTVKETFGA